MEWIDVNERVPDNEEMILVWFYESLYECWKVATAHYDLSEEMFYTTDGEKVRPGRWAIIDLPNE